MILELNDIERALLLVLIERQLDFISGLQPHLVGSGSKQIENELINLKKKIEEAK
jgi:hypothetical protein